jgi:Cytochrome P460
LRLTEARERLTAPGRTVDSVAASVGFTSDGQPRARPEFGKMKRPLVTLVLLTASTVALAADDAKLEYPANYREWIFLSSSLDMSYNKLQSMMGHSMFDNIFVDPVSYREFLKTGTWPEKTQLVMEMRGATGKGSINQQGKYQSGDPMGIEVHVKDSARFPGGWAFFAFGGGTEPAQALPQTADCYSCHQQHGAVNTTFVQFYPTLLKVATQKNTLSPNYHP